MRTLKDVNIGDSAVVVRVHGEGAIRRRIMDMGITKGVTVKVRKTAPLGDPLELTVTPLVMPISIMRRLIAPSP